MKHQKLKKIKKLKDIKSKTVETVKEYNQCRFKNNSQMITFQIYFVNLKKVM